MAARKTKPEGRAPGSLSKRTLDLMSEFERHHFDIVTEALSVYKKSCNAFDETGRPEFLETSRKSVATLLEYVYPKRKAVEVTGKDGEALLTSFADLMQKAANGIKKD